MSDPMVDPNSQKAGVQAPAGKGKPGSRLREFAMVAVVLLIIVGAAAFQEPIGAFFRLHLWDSAAPRIVVEEFMTAVQNGDQQKAQGFLRADELKPLMQNGKWVGYYMVSMAGRMDYLPDDLAPRQSHPIASNPAFITEADVAEVKTMVGTGKSLKYRLKMKGGLWKIEEIQGGRIHQK